MSRDSTIGTIIVAASLCVVCSVLVSGAAVGLRPLQEANARLFRQKNVLIAAGLLKQGESANADRVEELFKNFKTVVVDLETGQTVDDIDPAEYDQKEAARDPDRSVKTEGLKGFQRREKYSLVYLLMKDEKLSRVILPVYGKGLWSTMYGYLALEADKNTVAGLTFYQHGETPGLGAEIENPVWQAKWDGKEIRGEEGEIKIEVIKGTVDPSSPNAEHKIDGLSGATITSQGVSNMMQYWMSDEGFGKYLEQL